MKILSIVGSPRFNGNTHFLSKKFTEGAVGAEVEEVEEVFLHKLKVGPCLHCDGCVKEGVCKLKDDFGGIVEKMRASDAFVFSSPVYCWSVTGGMKCFIDRCHSMCYPTWETGVEGKPVFFIVGAGYPPREDSTFVLHHKIRVNTFVRMIRDTKLVTADLNLRDAMDPMAPIDPCVDALKLLYQYAVILGMEPLGNIGAVGLGHDRKAVRNRPDEIERALAAGAKFAAMAQMMKEKAIMSWLPVTNRVESRNGDSI